MKRSIRSINVLCVIAISRPPRSPLGSRAAAPRGDDEPGSPDGKQAAVLPLVSLAVTPHGVTHHIGMLVPRGQQRQNLTHPSGLEARESPTYCRGLNRFHGQKNRPSVDVGCFAVPSAQRHSSAWYQCARKLLVFSGAVAVG